MSIKDVMYEEFDLGSHALSQLKAEQTKRVLADGRARTLLLSPEDWRRLQLAVTSGHDMRRFRVRWGWAIVPIDGIDYVLDGQNLMSKGWKAVRTVYAA